MKLNQRSLMLPSLCFSAFAFVACGEESDDTTPDPTPILEPPAPGTGVQFTMNTTIEPGIEAEHCKFVKAPPEGLLINHDQVRFTEGSHHFLLYLTNYSEIPTKNDHGQAVDTSGVFDCSEGATNGWSVQSLVGGSQNASGESIVSFPPNVAMRVPGNAVLLMNAHYINATPEPLEPEIRINLYTIPEAELEQEGGLLFWYNIFIRADAMGSGRATMECPLPDDINIVNAQSHMHRRGKGYEAKLIAPGGGESTIYSNTAWEGVPVEEFAPELAVTGGSKIRFHCDYENADSSAVYQGPRSTDEMCMFIASYYPADSVTSFCASDPEDPIFTSYLGADWVGNGTATCGETLNCIIGIPDGSFDTFLRGLTDCVLASDPAQSEVVSDGVRCLLLSQDPQSECSAEIQACLAAN